MITVNDDVRMTPRQVVERLYEGIRRRDAAMVLAQLANELDWREAENFMLADRNPYRTADAVAEGVFGRLGSIIRDYEVNPTRIFDAGDAVIALGRSKGMFNATGRSFDAQHAHIWFVRDGKIVGFQQVIDTLAVWRAQQGL